MLRTLICVGIAAALAAAQQDDDGQYYPEKYEAPYAYREDSSSQPAYSAPTAYQAQPAPLPSHFQPQQPAYNPQPQAYKSDSKNAAILSEARYLSADGKFGAQYTQEDGVEFKEESDPDGNRRGSYSYVDPTGQRRTITYTAGKNGFQASGAHLPVGPAPVAPAAPQPYAAQPQQYVPQSAPQYAPQPQQYVPQPTAYQQQRAYSAPSAPSAPAGPAHPALTLSSGGFSLNSQF